VRVQTWSYACVRDAATLRILMLPFDFFRFEAAAALDSPLDVTA
jgi:hypothetical protein